MTDWKQITARIRRARTGKDPAGQLSNLFQKTRDAMVAFELARHFETSGQNAEAAKWYSVAAERFRRADWKTKAQEAAVRLGALPDTVPEAPPDQFQLTSPVVAMPEPALPFEHNAASFEAAIAPPQEEPASPQAPAAGEAPPREARRRRGRRGGRNRRKEGPVKETSASPAHPAHHAPPTHSRVPSPQPPILEPSEERYGVAAGSASLPRLPVESVSESGAAAATARGRYGDPGLSSRLSLLEMQFRRLLSCTPLKLDEADRAPVGPGVFLLTDSDLTTYYYVEACQTLRIAVGNLHRSGSSRRGGDSIKPRLADHLGIAESRVGKYLAEHCVVRFLQLDEGASHFAHFVIAVLRPTLND
jgi:hypothetical protein